MTGDPPFWFPWGPCSIPYSIHHQPVYCAPVEPRSGWVCPKCGCVWSPIAIGCDRCNSTEKKPEV